MKVLWFSNTPANADEYLNTKLKDTGGWLKALDQALQKHVELHIVFYGNEDKVIQHKETVYHSLKKQKSLFGKLKALCLYSVVDEDDLYKYLSVVEKVKPDIIHIHGTEEPFLCIQDHVDIPIVLSIQGNLTVFLHKYLSGFEKKYLKTRTLINFKSLLLPNSFEQNYKQFKKRQKIEERNLANVRYVMGRTAWDRRITRILAKDSKYFIEDRILRDSFYKHQWEPHQRKKIVLHTTNSNIFYKGFETVCQALNQLHKTGIECEMTVAGISETDLIVKITKKKLGKSFPGKGLIYLGKLIEDDLVRWLLNCDIYVMPSHIENNVNSLGEAMLLGVPCISTFVGGVGSLIKDNEEGILIQDGDPWAMAGAILELASDKEKAIKLGINARKIALYRHDKERISSEVVSNYAEIINETKHRKFFF